MGSATIKAVRERIRSVSGTMHITHAMQLVASSKIKRAQTALTEGRAYFAALGEAFCDLAGSGADSPFLRQPEKGKILRIVIAGDRGLAGGYNANVFKAACVADADTVSLPIGKKAVDHVRAHAGCPAPLSFSSVEKMTAQDCTSVARECVRGFLGGEYRRVEVVYTEYLNLLSQRVIVKPLLPAELPEQAPRESGFAPETEYEPSPDAVLSAVVPLYLAGVLWGAVRESFASEIASRQNAMDNATKNAEEMIDELSLQYNRARQGAITQELTEIVAGSAQQ